MSEPTGPGMDPEEYAAALDRLLDGLDANGPADAQVRADTDAIAHALGLIGGALAAEGSGVSAAGAVPSGAAGGATVVQLSSWRSKLNPRVLAAAASLVVLLGVGVPIALSASGGGDADESSSALSAPEIAADRAAALESAGEDAGNDAFSTEDGAAVGTTDAATGAAAGAATDTSAGSAVPGSAAAPMAQGDTLAARQKAAKQAGDAAFANAVACARAIVIGTITAVQPAPDGAHFNVTILVEEWIAPSSGPLTVTYSVFGSTANSPGVDENVNAGQRRLFVVAASPEERIYAYRQKDWAQTREQIARVRAERAGEACP